MAIIACPECEEKVSSLANACPHCGCPIKEFLSASIDEFEDTRLLLKRGKLYCEGLEVQQSYGEAAKWFGKAAKQGDAEAQYNLGQLYFNGQGVTLNYEEAAKWYRKAAEQDYDPAEYNLGLCMQYLQQNNEAAEWLKRAAEQGYAEAQYELGKAYRFGNGVQKDTEKAAEWNKKAADQGHADAQYRLALSYLNGQGEAQDSEEAVKWLQKAAEQEHTGAQYNLGVAYYLGIGVRQNITRAAELWTAAADQGDPNAQFNLSALYATGRGVYQDTERATLLLQKAAEQGHAEAQCYMKNQDEAVCSKCRSTVTTYWGKCPKCGGTLLKALPVRPIPHFRVDKEIISRSGATGNQYELRDEGLYFVPDKEKLSRNNRAEDEDELWNYCCTDEDSCADEDLYNAVPGGRMKNNFAGDEYNFDDLDSSAFEADDYDYDSYDYDGF